MKLPEMNKLLLWLIIGLILCLTTPLSASAAAENTKVRLGTELDLLPFVSDGYYSSSVVGFDHYNVRLITAKTKIPGFATPDGYRDWKLKNVTAVIIDYFPDENREGVWFAGGFEHWKSAIRAKSSGATGTFSQNIFTLGSGYVYNLNEHWYINPWIALHYNLSDHPVPVGSDVLQLKDIMYEASIKLGYRF